MLPLQRGMRRIDRAEDQPSARPATAGRALPAAWIEVDHAALRRNLQRVRARIAPATAVIAVVKANAYGHGASEVAHTLATSGAASLAVFAVEDGLELRQAGIDAPILVLGPSGVDAARAIAAARLVPTVCDLPLARALARAADGEPLPVHVKVDTGMSRFGVAAAAAVDLVRHLAALPRLCVAGIYTHFASISADDTTTLERQHAAFTVLLGELQQHAVRPPLRHACNSLALDVVPQAHFDAVRVGGALYGLATGTPWLDTTPEPVLTLKARIIHLLRVPAGVAAGYGSTWRATRSSRLALLPLGYADGLPRGLSNRGAVLVRGHRAPIAGLISMNQTIVDVTDVAGARLGDEAVLIGRQGRQRLRAHELAALYGGCAYELTAGLRESLPRVHL